MLNQKRVVAGLALASVVIAGACSETVPTEPRALVPDEASLFGAPADPQSHRSRDSHLVRLAEEVPGYGGHFYDEAGQLNIYMKGAVPMRTASALRSGLQPFGVDMEAQPVRMLAGQYTFAELDGMHQRASAVLGIGGVVYTDVDDMLNRLAIGVENSAAAADVRNALDVLGVPAAAVVIRETEPIVPMQTLRDRVRPVAGGLQINFPGFLCTLGFNVRSPERPNVHGFVTNSHCTNNRGTVDNTPYWQPSGSVASPADPNFIGTEVHDLPFFTGGSCPAGRLCRWSDSAGGRYAPGINNIFARIYRTTGVNTGSLAIDPANPMFTITAERPFPNIGDTMHKVGRTTGWTSGTVSQSCANTNVSGTNITMLCQEHVSGASGIVAGGDSGSGVFDNVVGNNVRLVGLLWGGGANVFVFSAMSEVRFENTPPSGLSWRTF
jgi:hypothetical protein